MCPRVARYAEDVGWERRDRWSTWLAARVTESLATRGRIADEANVARSRIANWEAARLAVSEDVAFRVGEALRTAGQIPWVSGAHALYASGHFRDLIGLVGLLSDRYYAIGLVMQLPYANELRFRRRHGPSARRFVSGVAYLARNECAKLLARSASSVEEAWRCWRGGADLKAAARESHQQRLLAGLDPHLRFAFAGTVGLGLTPWEAEPLVFHLLRVWAQKTLGAAAIEDAQFELSELDDWLAKNFKKESYE